MHPSLMFHIWIAPDDDPNQLVYRLHTGPRLLQVPPPFAACRTRLLLVW
jgi:hypothetical protein